jgi:hypothetical protein
MPTEGECAETYKENLVNQQLGVQIFIIAALLLAAAALLAISWLQERKKYEQIILKLLHNQSLRNHSSVQPNESRHDSSEGEFNISKQASRLGNPVQTDSLGAGPENQNENYEESPTRTYEVELPVAKRWSDTERSDQLQNESTFNQTQSSYQDISETMPPEEIPETEDVDAANKLDQVKQTELQQELATSTNAISSQALVPPSPSPSPHSNVSRKLQFTDQIETKPRQDSLTPLGEPHIDRTAEFEIIEDKDDVETITSTTPKFEDGAA